jgi:GMP synthase-like glutamine amidotransferase
MRVQCIRHVAFEGPGTIAQWAKRRGHTLAETRAGETAPEMDSFDMLVLLGGTMSACDDDAYPWLPIERAFIARAVEEGKLVLGICLGAQLLATALGGRVFRNPEPEIGWYPVSKTGAGRQSGVFAGWPTSFLAGHWHSDTFEPPEGTPVAFMSEACMRQAFETNGGRVVALQFHLEWNDHALTRLIEECGKELVPAAHVQDAERMLAHPELLAQTRDLMFELLDRMQEAA